jgi:ribosome maturation factor RimP
LSTLNAQLERVREFAQEVATREGCSLYELELVDGPRRILRVYIDRTPGGVSLEDCVNVSRGLNLRLDVEDVMPGGAYELEVSSPGLERKLTQNWHFGGAVGQTVQLRYRDQADGTTKPYEGKLVAVDGGKLSFENSKGPWSLDFENVLKARVLLGDALAKKPAPGKKG